MTMSSNGGADLQALMAIADRYARRLVADASSPSAVLLVGRAGELDIVMLDGDGEDIIHRTRLLLARSGASSAALLVEPAPSQQGVSGAAFWIFGESIDGATARRRYRFRPSFRTRRLTPLADGEDPDVEDLFRPLFPVHQTSSAADEDVTDEWDAATSSSSADTMATIGHIIAA